MRNPRLLRFLGAVQAHLEGAPGGLGRLSGFDPLELAVAIRTAVLCGHLAVDDMGQPAALTPAGWAWVAVEVPGLASLAAGLARAGRAAA